MTIEEDQSARYTHYIDGNWADPVSSETVPIVNPASGEIFSSVPRATVTEAEAAVMSARRAFDQGPWPRMTGQERAHVLHGFADALIAALGSWAGCSSTFTFDRKASRLLGFELI